MSRRWSDEELADLERLYPDRTKSAEDIQAHFGRSWNAIFVQANRKGLKRRYPSGKKRWTDDEKRRLQELYRSTESLEEVASKLGRSQSAVATMAHYLKLRMRDR